MRSHVGCDEALIAVIGLALKINPEEVMSVAATSAVDDVAAAAIAAPAFQPANRRRLDSRPGQRCRSLQEMLLTTLRAQKSAHVQRHREKKAAILVATRSMPEVTTFQICEARKAEKLDSVTRGTVHSTDEPWGILGHERLRASLRRRRVVQHHRRK